MTRRVTQVRFEHLADVHTARHTERVEHDVDRRAVGEVRHVLDRKDLGDDTLVAVAAGELVALADLALLTDVDADQLVHTRRQLVAVVAREHAHVDHLAGLAVRHLQARVPDLARLLTEDRAEQALFRRELGLALRRDLADEDVARADLGADADDPALVEVLEDVFAQVRDVTRDLLGTELGVAGIDLVLLDVDRREHVVLDQALAQHDRVLEVVTLPGHERDEQVLAERELAVHRGRTVGEHVALAHLLAGRDDRLLVDAGALVRAAELRQTVRDPAVLLVLDRDGVARRRR